MAAVREKGLLTVLGMVGFAKGYTDQPKPSPFFGCLHEIGALEASSDRTLEYPRKSARFLLRFFRLGQERRPQKRRNT
jgi:hypothetical protein